MKRMSPMSMGMPTAQHSTHRRSGISLVEVLVAAIILALSSGSIISTMIAARGLSAATDERAIAREAIDSTIEQLKAGRFGDLYQLYNSDDADDPGGPATAPGSGFEVTGLRIQVGDPDGRPGVIIFPEVAGVLREDSALAGLGMPRDLNLDGTIDSDSRANDYQVIPVIVRVDWRGATGNQSLQQQYLAVELW